MSAKYYDRVLTASGVSSKKVESDVATKIMAKFGWKEGDGLGAKNQGMTECIQIKRRAESAGLGAEDKPKNEWNDWWSKSYDSIAKKIKAGTVSDSSSDSSDYSSDSSSSSSSASSCAPRKTAIKKASVQQGKLRRVMRQERNEVKKA